MHSPVVRLESCLKRILYPFLRPCCLLYELQGYTSVWPRERVIWEYSSRLFKKKIGVYIHYNCVFREN